MLEELIITSWVMASTPSSCMAASWISGGMYAHVRTYSPVPKDSSQLRRAAGVVSPS
jgi:hypothetical protein